jgi:hypothetical protein
MILVGVSAKYMRRPSGENAIEFAMRTPETSARGLVPPS